MPDQDFAIYHFLATGGTTRRTMADRLADLINVREFNAKGDNSNDDLPGIQAAINYAMTHGGGKVFFPPGTYKLLSAPHRLVVGGSSQGRVELLGSGQNATTLTGTHAAGTFMVSSLLSDDVTPGTFDNIGCVEGLGIIYASSPSPANTGGVQTTTLTQPCFLIHDVAVAGYLVGIDTTNSQGGLLTDVNVAGAVNNPPNNSTPGALPGTVGFYIGSSVSAQECNANGGFEIAYALSGGAPSLFGSRSEVNRIGIRVGWGPAGETPANGFLISNVQTEANDVSLDLYNASGGLVTGLYTQAQISSFTSVGFATVSTATWSGGVAHVTTTLPHNLPNGTYPLQVLGTSNFLSGAIAGKWIIATVPAATPGPNNFDFVLAANPGAFTGSMSWAYPQYHAIRCRKVTETAIFSNAIAFNFAYSTIDFAYATQLYGMGAIGAPDAANTAHRNNVFWGVRVEDGVIPPSNLNLAGWDFRNFSGLPARTQGVGTWNLGSVGVPTPAMTFAGLPGNAGVLQDGPFEGQEFNIINGSPGAAIFGAIISGGGTGHYRVRYDGTNWRRIA